MLFHTVDFVVFFAVLLGLFAVFRTSGWRKAILLAASYFFYAWWDLRREFIPEASGLGQRHTFGLLILLLAFVTVVNYHGALRIASSSDDRAKKRWLAGVCVVSMGLLSYFKYANFFSANAAELLRLVGLSVQWNAIDVVLPVGISFYTFHMLSYTIDVYRGKIEATRNWVDFAIFGSFFPQLVAGPILRAGDFLPGLAKPVKLYFNQEILFLCLRGLVKKLVVADNVASIPDRVFAAPESYPSAVIWLATICYSIQIYCDFSGYSDIAIGLTKVFGINLPLNFNRPYFARNPSDFWARWHISLSTWLRDYLYIPLGGNRKGEFNTYRNLMLTMLLGGLWHGASWNFVLWGFLHGLILVVHRLYVKFTGREGDPNARGAGFWASWAIMQYLVLVTWITFRLTDTEKMLVVLRKFILFDFNFSLSGLGIGNLPVFTVGAVAGGFLLAHWLGFRWRDRWEQVLARQPIWASGAVCVVAGLLLYWFWPLGEAPFIYFQF